MALLKYTGDIDLSRNNILDILKIQGPDFYEGLSNNLEITTKNEAENSSGSLILRSGTGGTGITTGKVYLFAGSFMKLEEIKGITLTTGGVSINHTSVETITNSLTRTVTDTAGTTKKFEETIGEGGYSATSNTTYTLNAINAFTLNAGKQTANSGKTFSYPLEIKTSESDYSKASIKTTTLNATTSLSTPVVDIGNYATVKNYVDLGDIRIKYDSSSQSLIFGAV